MQQEKAKLSELTRNFKTIPQKTINVMVKSKPPLEEIEEMQEAIRKANGILKDVGRLIVRYSGTEPLLRITVEAFENAMVDRCLEIVKKAAEKSLSLKE